MDIVELDFLNDAETRSTLLKELEESIVDNFQEDFSKELREYELTVSLGDEQFPIKMNELFLNTILLPARFVVEGYVISKEDFVFDVKSINKTIASYFEETINAFVHQIPIQTITKVIAKVIENLSRQAWRINLLKGNSVNIYDLLHLMMKDSRFSDIINFTSNENAQFSEIESSVEEQTEKLIELLKADEHDSCLKNMLGSISKKQFQQVYVNISLKPDLYGMIIERPINTSFFRGMRDSTDYYINATGARKALITNATQVRAAGYLARKLALLQITTTLDDTVENCGTTNYLKQHIPDKEYAARFTNRYYKLKPSDKEFKFTTTAKTTKALIGKTIYLASPAKCGLSGNKMCRTCYGLLADINQYHAAMSSVLLLSEQILQMLLSSKHLLQVSADKIELPEGVEEYFEVDKNSLIALKPCKITIDEINTDEETGTSTIGTMTITDGDKIIEATFIDLDLFMHSIQDKLNSDMEVEVKTGEEAFRISVENNEISAPLKRLLKIIESEEELNSKGGMSGLVTEILNLLIRSDIKLSAVGVEQIVRVLGRDPDDVQERSSADDTYYLKLTSAIVNSNSPAVSLAFERHKYLLETNIFDKHESSIIDNIF